MYELSCRRVSDINQHVPTLYERAKECESILECGVADVVSSWGFLKGLTENGKRTKRMTCCDLKRSEKVDALEKIAVTLGVDFTFLEKSDLDITEVTEVDLTFIDTWHVYGHLKRELAKFAPITKKYIIMHDTTVDEFVGESKRSQMNIEKQMETSGYPREEIELGLSYAINEFLLNNPEWEVKAIYVNNNGMAILQRIVI